MHESALSQTLQDAIAHLCITSDDFLRKCKHALDPTFLTEPVTMRVVEICYDYFDKFQYAPKGNFREELGHRLIGMPLERRELQFAYLDRLLEQKVLNDSYVLHRLNTFVRASELSRVAVKFAQDVSDGDFASAEGAMRKALKAGVPEENVGIDYFTDKSFMHRSTDNGEILTPTGIPALNGIIGGYKRKQLLCFMGGPKGKKSWALMHVAKPALLHGLNVLHISHEMTDEEVQRRYDRMFGALVKEKEPQEVTVEIRNEQGVTEKIQRTYNTVYDTKAVARAREAMQSFGGRLVIKKYPMGGCSMSEIYRLLDHLEDFEGFVPDILLNDYVDIMKGQDGQETRHKLNDLYMAHKGLADDRSILVVTASQVRREAIRRPILTLKDFAEDIRKAANVDLAIAVCQTDAQIKVDRARLYVVASRGGGMDRYSAIHMNLDIGQFCMWSRADWELEPKKENEEQEDEM